MPSLAQLLSVEDPDLQGSEFFSQDPGPELKGMDPDPAPDLDFNLIKNYPKN
jgi:hypothetical protein